MTKKFFMFLVSGFIAMNLCGCALCAGLIAESQKVARTFDASYGRTIEAVKDAMKAENIKFKSADIKESVAKIKGQCKDESIARIEIDKISDTQSTVEIRIGTSDANQDSAKKFLDAVELCLGNSK